jgi:hypothetical protein
MTTRRATVGDVDEGYLVPLGQVLAELGREIEAEQNRKMEVVSGSADKLEKLINSGRDAGRRR